MDEIELPVNFEESLTEEIRKHRNYDTYMKENKDFHRAKVFVRGNSSDPWKVLFFCYLKVKIQALASSSSLMP